MQRLLTIGVYGWTADAWLRALQDAGCDLLVDIRARRGVRGHEYAFANRARLETMLAKAGIGYLHLPQLAPGESIRHAQDQADRGAGIRRRDRDSLTPAFVEGYEREVADRLDWQRIAQQLDTSTPALLCVERVPKACHRSLAAAQLAHAANVKVEHLVPI